MILRRLPVATVALAGLLALSACGSDPLRAEQAAPVVPQTVVTSAPETPSTPTPSTSPTASASVEESDEEDIDDPDPAPEAPDTETVDFVMPDLAGKSLQDAQDELQDEGVYFTTSHDLLGARDQDEGEEWKVCTSNPAAGTPVQGNAADLEGKVDLGAVQLSENCPS